MKMQLIGFSILLSAVKLFSCHASQELQQEQQDSQKKLLLSSPNKYWKHLLIEEAGLYDDDDTEYDKFDDMQRCLKDALQSENIDLSKEESKPSIVDTLIDSEHRTILVEIGNAITPSQAKAVIQLAACTRKHFPESRFEHRSFQHPEYPESAGGNDCTFLNILVQLFLPNVFQNVVNITELAYKTAGWGRELNLRPPNTCGLRTSEYLNYDGFKGLGGHSDTGSLYTTLFALTDPKLYKGGEYYIFPMDEPDDRLYYFKPRQYSAVVFLSETFHGVTDIDGPREMFTNEFWVYDDVPWGTSSRPINALMDVFVNRVEETLDNSVDYYKWHDLVDLWPFDEEEDIEDFDGFHSGYGYYNEEDYEDEYEEVENSKEREEEDVLNSQTSGQHSQKQEGHGESACNDEMDCKAEVTSSEL